MLQAHYKNFSKRLVKRPKLYFYDTGIACRLLEIESVEHLHSHYLRGGLAESLIITELQKWYYNTARQPALTFWRDNRGNEIDCIIERADKLIPIEIKAGQTVIKDYFKGLTYWNKLTNNDPHTSYVVYGGSENYQWPKGQVLSWRSIDTLLQDSYSR